MAKHTGIGLEAVAADTRGSVRSSPADEESPGKRAARAESEAQRLIQWASQNGKLGCFR